MARGQSHAVNNTIYILLFKNLPYNIQSSTTIFPTVSLPATWAEKTPFARWLSNIQCFKPETVTIDKFKLESETILTNPAFEFEDSLTISVKLSMFPDKPKPFYTNTDVDGCSP